MTDQEIVQRYLAMLKTALGPDVLSLLDDEEVIEIMLNPDGQIVTDRLGLGKGMAGLSIGPQQGANIIKLVASFKNEVADVESPVVSSEIPIQSARFQGWLPPVVSSPCFAIRKRAIQVFTLQNYVSEGLISQDGADYLKQGVLASKNIMVIGGTSSGKTTFANALLGELYQSDQRILVLEDLPELQVKAEDVVTMETTPFVSMRDLVQGALRMRPDRIIIGEVRDGAALELLKAWNTGHPGGVCTLHANSIESAPHRLEDLIQEVVAIVPRNLIVEVVNILVFLERDSNNQRRVSQVAELLGYDGQNYQFKFMAC